MSEVPAATRDLLEFIAASPTPWHAVATVEARLREAGYVQLHEEAEAWSLEPGAKAWVTRSGGSIVAFRMGTRPVLDSGMRIVAAHTDSPNLRLKPRPDLERHGYATLGVETYGGVLLHTWLDRDLGLSGRVSLRSGGGGIETRLLCVDRPICRIPSLAIHLNRGVNKSGLTLNEQDHLPPIWGLANEEQEGKPGIQNFLSQELGVDADLILGFELCLHDVQPPTVSGVHEEFIHAARLDNLGSCHPAISALLATDKEHPEATAVIALFDHEEIGSRTSRGAAGSFLRDVLTRLAGGARQQLSRAIPRSFMVSTDMSHGVHPHHSDKHDGEHRPVLGRGPALKTHPKWKYATDAEAMATFRGLCQDADVPLQEFVSRSDLPCGSTVGPIVAAEVGLRAVDVGNPMLSMHSIREMASAHDPPLLQTALEHLLQRARL